MTRRSAPEGAFGTVGRPARLHRIVQPRDAIREHLAAVDRLLDELDDPDEPTRTPRGPARAFTRCATCGELDVDCRCDDPPAPPARAREHIAACRATLAGARA